MIAAWLNVPERLRALVAAALCAALFLSDLITKVEMNESQLYPAALLLLYRARDRRLIWYAAGFAVFLTALGYALDPPDNIWDGVTNRSFSILVIAISAVGLIELAKHEQRLVEETITDPLTGVLNRRRFTELSVLEEGRARRHGFPFTVLMLDIDHFKRVNDKYGHPVGDKVIKSLADMCSKSLRTPDLLARFGGEEFVLTLPETDLEGASVVAERLRRGAEKLELATELGPLRFTISVGISAYRSGMPFAEVVESADQALYRAKEGGRNRVELSARGNWRPRGALS
ncbi:MAG: GGDEF domain-containing protein, partial [Proteobacteria bacterium]|nr:GGDEF domain-containing protein [Pseudomonadota bacterium]